MCFEDETIKFGEIIFFPNEWLSKMEPEKMNLVFGEMLNIDDQIRQENSV